MYPTEHFRVHVFNRGLKDLDSFKYNDLFDCLGESVMLATQANLRTRLTFQNKINIPDNSRQKNLTSCVTRWLIYISRCIHWSSKSKSGVGGGRGSVLLSYPRQSLSSAIIASLKFGVYISYPALAHSLSAGSAPFSPMCSDMFPGSSKCH